MDFNTGISTESRYALANLVPVGPTTLKHLSLRGSSLGPEGAVAVADRLKKNPPSLTSLTLFRNDLGDYGARASRGVSGSTAP